MRPGCVKFGSPMVTVGIWHAECASQLSSRRFGDMTYEYIDFRSLNGDSNENGNRNSKGSPELWSVIIMGILWSPIESKIVSSPYGILSVA